MAKEEEFVGLWHYSSGGKNPMATMEAHQFHESQRKHYVNYARNYLAVGVMWGIFTICFTIINIVVFVQPQWIGDTENSPGIGYFGLYRFCELFQAGQELVCQGRFDDFPTISSAPFQAATFFVGFSFLAMLICVLCLLLFAFIKADKVFYGCGCLQMLSGVCMLLGCIIYPAGWDNEHVARVCGGDTGKYSPGHCNVRWAYILAIIGVFDILVLSILAFVMASRYARKRDYAQNITKSELNGFNDTASHMSKPSMLIQPVLAVPPPDHSEYSTGKRSRKGEFTL